MVVSGALSRLGSGLGKVRCLLTSKYRKGTFTPAWGTARRSEQQCKVVVHPMRKASSTSAPRKVVLKASQNDFQGGRYTKQEAVQDLLPEELAFDSPAPRPKSQNLDVQEATEAQEGHVHALWNIMLCGIQEPSVVTVSDFRKAFLTTAPGLLSVWPFNGSTNTITNVVTSQYNIADLLWTSHSMQRLQLFLPFLEELLLTARKVQPRTCPALLDILSLLAEAEAKPELQQVQPNICSILHCYEFWQVTEDLSIWSGPPDHSVQGSPKDWPKDRPTGPVTIVTTVGLLDQPRPHLWAESFTALQPAAAAVPTAPSTIAMKAATPTMAIVPHSSQGRANSASEAAIAEMIETARAEEQQAAQKAIDKLKAQLDSLKAQQRRAVDNAIAEQDRATKQSVARRIVAGNVDRDAKIAILLLLSESPNDHFSIRAYCQRHTNHFHGDFNARMVQKRRQTLSTENTQTMDDSGGSVTQSTGLPDQDVYV